MTVRTLKTFPKDEKFLRTKSEPVALNFVQAEEGAQVAVLPEDVSILINDMYDTLFAFRAAGLSAVQVGEHKRVIVYLDDNDEPAALVNPEIVCTDYTTKAINSLEGCLSFPGVQEVIKAPRAEEITVKGVNEHGEEVTLLLTGQAAIAVQHEIDHLDGVLFIDHMGPTARRLALKRLKKVERRIKHAQENMEKHLRSKIRVA